MDPLPSPHFLFSPFSSQPNKDNKITFFSLFLLPFFILSLFTLTQYSLRESSPLPHLLYTHPHCHHGHPHVPLTPINFAITTTTIFASANLAAITTTYVSATPIWDINDFLYESNNKKCFWDPKVANNHEKNKSFFSIFHWKYFTPK